MTVATQTMGRVRALQAVEAGATVSLQRICGLAKDLLNVDAACVSLHGQETDEPAYAGERFGQPLSRIRSFTLFAGLRNDPMIVHDVLEDGRLRHNRFVTESGMRFFASLPLMSGAYGRVGTLCLIDRSPRSLSSSKLDKLQVLVDTALAKIEHDAARLRCTREIPGSDWQGSRDKVLEARLRWTERGAGVGHCLVDLEQGLCQFSDGLHRLLRSPSSQPIQRFASVRRWFREEDWRLIRIAFEMAALHGRDFELPTTVVRSDGLVRSVLLKVRCEAANLGGSRQLFVVCLDVTALNESIRCRELSEDRLRLLSENGSDLIVQFDAQARWLYTSPACRHFLGYETSDVLGIRHHDLVHPDDVHDLELTFALLSTGKVTEAKSARRYVRKDGSTVWVEEVVRASRMPLQPSVAYVATLRDVSALKVVEDELRSKTRLLDRAFEHMDQGLIAVDAKGLLRVANGKAASLLGLDPTDLSSGRSIRSVARDALRIRTVRVAKPKTRVRRDAREITTSADRILEMRRSPGVDGDAIVTLTDVTTRAIAEQRLAHMETHDVITGLPNRKVFDDRLDTEIAGDHRDRLSVLFLDLDGFKSLGEARGRRVSDDVLAEVASRLRCAVDLGDLVAAIGGDMFGILLCGIPTRTPESVAHALREFFAQPIVVKDCAPISMSVSVGVACAPIDGTDGATLCRSANVALSAARAAGGDTVRRFTASIARMRDDRLFAEYELKTALLAGQFELAYQPIVRVADGSICAFEALLRWNHPSRGSIPPSAFIPIAEESGAIVPIGRWILKEACTIAATWPAGIRVAVNVSALQFRHGDIERAVEDALSASKLRPERLELEVTESLLVEDLEHVHAICARLRALGVRLALDDFGTGYASLTYLQKLPFDKIKIDRSFIASIEEEGTAAIVTGIVTMCLGRTITAEGVETARQFALAARAGCDEVQGYFFSRPVTETSAYGLCVETPSSWREMVADAAPLDC